MKHPIVVNLLSFLALYLLSKAQASHFRHAILTWAPVNSYSNTLILRFRMAFRRSFSSSYNCDQSIINSGALRGSGGSWIARCRNSYCSSRTIADTGFQCTDFSVDEDWTMGEKNFTYTFASVSKEWVVSYQGCCWISSLVKYPDGNWLVTTTINLTRRSDTGRINSSPVSKSPAIIRFKEGCLQSFRIPVEDPDDDVVRCRWATYPESSRHNDSFPHGVIDERACLLQYNARRSGTAGTYAVALTLEDFPVGTTDFNSATPFSAVGLQFLVIISARSGSCADRPLFTKATPTDGECTEVQIGLAYRAVIEVTLQDPSRRVTKIVTSSPVGMQLTPLRYDVSRGIFSRNITWYPTQYQVGQQLYCFKAVDSAGSESEWRCITILVGLSNTPRVVLGTRWPRYPSSQLGTGLIRLSIQFDRVIKKPRTSAYIRLVLLPREHTVYKVDTLSRNVVISANKTELLFTLPKAALSMKGSYAILIDRGAVVGSGCSFDGPPTPGISSSQGWRFNVGGICSSGYYLDPPYYRTCTDVNECGSQGSTVSQEKVPDFHLQLPADCEQVCHNTPGSYICSCVSGYQLASDGKSCSDINECSVNNGGCSHHCYNIPGAHYCGCPKGTTMAANNLTCVQPGVAVTCGKHNMTISLEKQSFSFVRAEEVHLRYSSCKATENGTHVTISTLLNDCGTSVNETQDALLFWNELRVDAVIIDGVITRSQDIRLPFYCSYSRKKLLSLSFNPLGVYYGQEAGYGNFTFKMDFFKSGSFLVPYSTADYPLQLRLNDYIYVRYSVESSADLVIMAENCRATKDGSFYSLPQYKIIQNGCGRDTTMVYSYNSNRPYQEFRMKVFRFFNDYNAVYLHCELLACHRSSRNSRCQRGCMPGNRRKRRAVGRDGTEHMESTTKNIVSRGPLIFKDEVKQGDTGQGKVGALIGGVAGAGGVCILAFAALGILLVKYRLARRLMNRNKVGDLFATQEEMGRKSANVKEDDMNTKEDSL
ncbi:uncharacterized protein LOC114963363 [Acropora millepora]|uniref:uncharacterized protein LOC114963363 n=1 Tax=Acropora millepora TaxID=45264 RepID=UPI001CF1CDFF|nr:uncharacterized protein LOC114963363 [Acropora millepora]